MEPLTPEVPDLEWIDTLTDEQCAEVFWLYVDPPEPFLNRFPRALLGRALRYALREIAREARPAPNLPGSDRASVTPSGS